MCNSAAFGRHLVGNTQPQLYSIIYFGNNSPQGQRKIKELFVLVLLLVKQG